MINLPTITRVAPNYVSELIYDTSETAPNNKNLFNDYDTLITHINNDLSGAIVRVTLRQNETLPVRTSQNWNGITWNGDGNPSSLGGLILTVPDGFTVSSWTSAFIDGGLHLKSVSTTPVMTVSTSPFLFAMIFANQFSCTQAEFFRLTGNVAYFVLGISGGSTIQDGGYEVVNLHSNYPIFITSTEGANASINAETIRGTVGLWLNQFGDLQSATGTITNAQSNLSSSITVNVNTKYANLGGTVNTITANTNLTYAHDVVICDSSGATANPTLPNCTGAYTGKRYTIVCYDATSGVTINTTSSQQIRTKTGDTSTSIAMAVGNIIELISTGVYWQNIGGNI